MSGDPRRWTDALSDAPDELTQLVRSVEGPPPLPPAIRLDVRGRLSRAATPPPNLSRWIAPSVVGAAAVIAGLVLWTFRPGPPPSPTLTPEASPSVEVGDGVNIGPRVVYADPTASPTEPVPPPVIEEQDAPPVVAPAGGPEASPHRMPPRPAAGTTQLRIAVTGGWGDVYLDGAPLGTSPQLATVAPGRHQVTIRFPDGREDRRHVMVPPDGASMVIAAPPSARPAPEPETIPQVPSGRRRPQPGHAPEPRAAVPVDESSRRPPVPRTRSASDLRAFVTANADQVRRCAERHRVPPGQSVRVTVRMNISPGGAVTRAVASGGGTPELQQCVERTIARWRFSPAQSPTALSYPFLFNGGAAPPVASPSGVGSLTVNTQPWSAVYVDGRRVGNTPVLRLELPAGRHEIRLETADGRSVRETLVIEAGQTSHLVRQF